MRYKPSWRRSARRRKIGLMDLATFAIAFAIVLFIVRCGKAGPTEVDTEPTEQAKFAQVAKVDQGPAGPNALAEPKQRDGKWAWLAFIALCALLLVGLWALFVRASVVHGKDGHTIMIVLPSLRGLRIRNPNREPGPDPATTARDQAVQMAGAMAKGGLAPQERRAAVQNIGQMFTPGAIPALQASGLDDSHVERLLLEGGDDYD